MDVAIEKPRIMHGCRVGCSKLHESVSGSIFSKEVLKCAFIHFEQSGHRRLGTSYCDICCLPHLPYFMILKDLKFCPFCLRYSTSNDIFSDARLLSNSIVLLLLDAEKEVLTFTNHITSPLLANPSQGPELLIVIMFKKLALKEASAWLRYLAGRAIQQ